ncbi:hypothetical protein AX14_005695 [Amanita brunnescens Koide BX004]|nr:hypothetical protein AX14_005695 [Amanita brunnescens Koide BX004]
MDFITNLPTSNGFDSIFILVNQGLPKGVILCPGNKMINAEETTKLYIDNVFIQFGLPDIIISDRGPQFTSKCFTLKQMDKQNAIIKNLKLISQFAHNSRTHEALKKSPIELIYGTKPITLLEASEKTNSPVANDHISQLYKAREEALATHELLACIKMKERITHHSKPFKVNDQVLWLESKNLKIISQESSHLNEKDPSL